MNYGTLEKVHGKARRRRVPGTSYEHYLSPICSMEDWQPHPSVGQRKYHGDELAAVVLRKDLVVVPEISPKSTVIQVLIAPLCTVNELHSNVLSD
jgi:hypothetical protein